MVYFPEIPRCPILGARFQDFLRLVVRFVRGGLPRPVFALTRALGFFSSERIFGNIPRKPTPLQ